MSKQNHKSKQQSSHSYNPVASTVPHRSFEIEGQNLPSFHEIEVLAYQIYEEKGGTDLENWLEAERRLKKRQF